MIRVRSSTKVYDTRITRVYVCEWERERGGQRIRKTEKDREEEKL